MVDAGDVETLACGMEVPVGGEDDVIHMMTPSGWNDGAHDHVGMRKSFHGTVDEVYPLFH